MAGYALLPQRDIAAVHVELQTLLSSTALAILGVFQINFERLSCTDFGS
jgi:hypothetical protein